MELKWYDFEVFEQANYDGGTFDKTLVPFTDIKSGTTIVSDEISEDATVKIASIEGASSQVVTVQGKEFTRVSVQVLGTREISIGRNWCGESVRVLHVPIIRYPALDVIDI